MNPVLADVFAMYLKTKNFHWHMSGPHFRAHNVCDRHRDFATASFIEVWLDETEKRIWLLFEATRDAALAAVA